MSATPRNSDETGKPGRSDARQTTEPPDQTVQSDQPDQQVRTEQPEHTDDLDRLLDRFDDIERIDRLLDVQGGVPAPALVGYTPGAEGVSLSVTLPELDPRGAGASLFGFVAPPEWSAVGMSIIGTARSADHRRDPAGDARVDVLVDRSGVMRSRLTLDGDSLPTDGSGAGHHPGGVMVDALHRVLGLPSPGEIPPVSAMIFGIWLDQILKLPRGRRRPTWTDAVVIDAPRPAGRTAVPRSPEALAESLDRAATTLDWSELRSVASDEDDPRFDLLAEEAAWMDDILFARWMLDGVPSPAVVHRELDGVADPGLLRGITRVAELLGLPEEWLFEDVAA